MPNDLLRNDLRDDELDQSAHWSQSLVNECHGPATADGDLMRVVAAWPLLPPHIHSAILAFLEHSLAMGDDFPWPERL